MLHTVGTNTEAQKRRREHPVSPSATSECLTAYRYGMLFVRLGLLSAGLMAWRLFPPTRSNVLNLVVAMMLLVNHLVFAFLPSAWQRRVIVPQFILIMAALIFVFRRDWP